MSGTQSISNSSEHELAQVKPMSLLCQQIQTRLEEFRRGLYGDEACEDFTTVDQTLEGIKEMAEDVTKLNQHIAATRGASNRLLAENNQRQQELDEIDSRIDAKGEKLHTLRQEFKELQDTQLELQRQNRDLSSRKEVLERKEKAVELRLKTADLREEQLHDGEQQLTNERQQMETEQGRILAREQKVAGDEETLTKTRDDLRRRVDEVTQREKHITDESVELNTVKAHQNDESERLQALQDRLQHRREELDDRKQRQSELQSRLTEEKNTLDTRKTQLELDLVQHAEDKAKLTELTHKNECIHATLTSSLQKVLVAAELTVEIDTTFFEKEHEGIKLSDQAQKLVSVVCQNLRNWRQSEQEGNRQKRELRTETMDQRNRILDLETTNSTLQNELDKAYRERTAEQKKSATSLTEHKRTEQQLRSSLQAEREQLADFRLQLEVQNDCASNAQTAANKVVELEAEIYRLRQEAIKSQESNRAKAKKTKDKTDMLLAEAKESEETISIAYNNLKRRCQDVDEREQAVEKDIHVLAQKRREMNAWYAKNQEKARVADEVIREFQKQ